MFRQDAAREAEFFRFADALLRIRHGADFARQSDFAEHHRLVIERQIFKAGGHGETKTQIYRRLVNLDAADHVDEDILRLHVQPHDFFQHGNQQRNPVRVHAFRHAARRAEICRRDEGLQFNQNRAAAFDAARHRGPGHLPFRAFRQKERGRVRHFFQPARFHLEHADFIGRAEAIFHGAQNAVNVLAFALEIQNGIHDMLKDFWPGNRARFRDVADDERGHARALRKQHQLRRHFAHLADASLRRTERRRVHGLNRVNNQDVRIEVFDMFEDVFEAGFRQNVEVGMRNMQPLAAQPRLPRRFFAGDVQDLPSGETQAARHLQQQRGFSDAGIAAD